MDLQKQTYSPNVSTTALSLNYEAHLHNMFEVLSSSLLQDGRKVFRLFQKATRTGSFATEMKTMLLLSWVHLM